MSDGGVNITRTVLGSAPGGNAVRHAVSVLINQAILQPRSATGTTLPEVIGEAAVEFLARTATGEASAGTAADGAVTLSARTARGLTPDVSDVVLEPRTASGIALVGTIADGAAVLLARVATGTHSAPNSANGTAVFQPRLAIGFGLPPGTASGSVRLLHRTVAVTHLGGSVGSGAITLESRRATGVGSFPATATGAVRRPYMRVNGYGESTLASTYRTWVANTANDALTEYTGFAFNSYATFNGKQYAAGPSGLFELVGDDDAGTAIEWTVQTGMMDDKKPVLKTLGELLVGIRFDGPIRVRVYTDEETYYDYTLQNYKENLLHQVRVKCGRGLLSRYYRIELSGMGGTAFEIDSLQIPMEPVVRRIG